MKTRKFLSVLLCGLTALCITSCIGDDNNDEGLTFLPKEQAAQCFQLMKGNYTGYLFYSKDNTTNQQASADSVAVSWSVINDSTITVSNIPSNLIAGIINHTGMKEALAEAAPQTLKCYYKFVSSSPMQFLAYPASMSYKLNYGGKEHKVDVAFYVNTPYSFGEYVQNTQRMNLQVIIGAIYEDGNSTSYLRESMPLVFSSREKKIF